MEDLLFLSHRIPYPPNKGDKIRSYHLLQFLAKRYRVHLGCFIDDENDWQYVEANKAMISGESCFISLNPLTAKVRSLSGFLTNQALTIPYYKNRKMAGFVNKLLKDKPIKNIVVYSAALSQYVIAENPQQIRKTVDFVDVDSDKWCQYAKDMGGIKRWVFAREGKKLLTYERKLAQTFNTSLFVSKAEAELFKTLAPESSQKIDYWENGVDQKFFSPEIKFANPYPQGQIPLVFTGAMGYRPNVDAVVWFAKEILPLIRQKIKQCHFFIVGGGASQSVLQLDQIKGVSVVGRVKDIRPYIAYARVSVAPLRLARGIQNKVLEAMAMARPVVATQQAIEGINLPPDMERWINNSETEFAQSVLTLLGNNPQENTQDNQLAKEAGEAGLNLVRENYNWDNNLKRVLKALDKG
ncbi:MAG: TIGR03087 family PEP-CTERM/XrtA system glycosyltransferase [Magnetococcales bacterium]|nr:TIGR03087 family PEP-CTERM/XrtA system glycosyltransferase [Magnetococcales bacterium]